VLEAGRQHQVALLRADQRIGQAEAGDVGRTGGVQAAEVARQGVKRMRIGDASALAMAASIPTINGVLIDVSASGMCMRSVK
jgi:hypothetical protein